MTDKERLEWYKAYRDSHTDYECIKDYWEKEIAKLEEKLAILEAEN